MLIEQDIAIDSACEHHFLPITGFAHVAYIPNGRVIGLSKINRLVNYYAHRPQVQERLCLQIMEDLQKTLNTKSVMVMVTAKPPMRFFQGHQRQIQFHHNHGVWGSV